MISLRYINVKCDWCEIVFLKYEKRLGKRNFCSKACVNKHRSKKLNPEGYQRKWNAGHLSEYNRKNNPSKMRNETRVKIREAHLGKGEGKAYKKIFRRHEHRVIAEQKIGRKLKPGEVVHHIDGDKLNNDPKNLMVFSSQKQHIMWHAKHDMKWGVTK